MGIRNNLNHRKQYAKKCYLNNWRHNRAFDTCFEMGDAEKVAMYLLNQCEKVHTTHDLIKINEQQRLIKAIGQSNLNYWRYGRANNWQYAGYEEKAA